MPTNLGGRKWRETRRSLPSVELCRSLLEELWTVFKRPPGFAPRRWNAVPPAARPGACLANGEQRKQGERLGRRRAAVPFRNDKLRGCRDGSRIEVCAPGLLIFRDLGERPIRHPQHGRGSTRASLWIDCPHRIDPSLGQSAGSNDSRSFLGAAFSHASKAASAVMARARLQAGARARDPAPAGSRRGHRERAGRPGSDFRKHGARQEPCPRTRLESSSAANRGAAG